MSKYCVVFRQNDLIGSEEYDGGDTIAHARETAEFFAANLPKHVRIRICTVDSKGRLSTVEVTQEGTFFGSAHV